MTIAAILLVMLAGCSGLVGDETNSTATPAQTNNDPRNTSTATTTATQSLPAGVNEGGITNATKLAATNQRVLFDSGYIAEVRLHGQITQGSRTRNVSLAQREVVAHDTTRFLFQTVQRMGPRNSRTAIWSNQSVTVRRTQRGNQTQFGQPERASLVDQFAARRLFVQYAGPGDYELVNETTRGNRTLYVFRADQYVNKTTGGMPSAENVTAYRSRFAVDEKGRIHYFDVTMRYTGPRGGTASLRVKYLVRQIGNVSIQKPRWVDEALAASEGSGNDDHGHGHDHG